MRTAYVGCTCAQRHTTTWGSTIAFLLVTAAGEREEEWSEMKTKKKRGTGTQQRKDYAGLGVCRTQSVGGFVGAIFGRSIVVPIKLCIYLLSWPKGGREGVQCKDRIREKRVLKSRGRCSAKSGEKSCTTFPDQWTVHGRQETKSSTRKALRVDSSQRRGCHRRPRSSLKSSFHLLLQSSRYPRRSEGPTRWQHWHLFAMIACKPLEEGNGHLPIWVMRSREKNTTQNGGTLL